tara:strand:- start:69 stop:470 length:402 start_codon:yes stop_codon:yes gene_type:complete
MLSSLHDEASIKETIRAYLQSHEWWMIMPGDRTDALAQIERSFYRGEANADFHILMGPYLPGWSIAFAKKSRMTPSQLAKLAKIDKELLADRDILSLCSPDDQPRSDKMLRANAELQAFAAWLGPIDGPVEPW